MTRAEEKEFIAQFMGLEKTNDALVVDGKTMRSAHYEPGYKWRDTPYAVSGLPYNTSWDCLMEVVRKIYDVAISRGVTYDSPYAYLAGRVDDLKHSLLSGRIDRVYPDVVKIIQLYNKFSKNK